MMAENAACLLEYKALGYTTLGQKHAINSSISTATTYEQIGFEISSIN